MVEEDLYSEVEHPGGGCMKLGEVRRRAQSVFKFTSLNKPIKLRQTTVKKVGTEQKTHWQRT